MSRWFALGAAMLIIACDVTSTPPAQSPSPKAAACRLPVMLWTYPNLETQGGFIDTSTGVFTPDPESVMVFDNASGLMRTPKPPYLYGGPGDSAWATASYDWTRHRWLPVASQWISPDASEYAYAVANQGVHLVDVSSGVDNSVSATSTPPTATARFFVAGYTKSGVYLTQWGPTGGPGLGLWRLDPASHAITQAGTDSPGLGVFVGETPLTSPPTSEFPDAWWTNVSTDFSTANDPRVYHQYLSETVGQHGETWFDRPGFRMNVIGVDTAGRAIVQAQSAGELEVWQLATPNSATKLYTTTNDGKPGLAFKTAFADHEGWWIGSRTGVFLANAGSFTQVSKTPAIVAGPCN